MELTNKDILHLAKMMKLALTDKEVEKFRGEMSSILRFIKELEEVDIKKAMDVGQVTGEENNWRKDVVNTLDSQPETLLNAAPNRKDDFIKVPGVFND